MCFPLFIYCIQNTRQQTKKWINKIRREKTNVWSWEQLVLQSEKATHHSVVLHVAGPADGFVIFHHIRFSSQDGVTVKAAEMLQVPVLSLRLGVLITEDQLGKRTYQSVSSCHPLCRDIQEEVKPLPHHSRHSGASRCLHNGVHSTCCLSSRSRSCPQAVRGRYSTQSMRGATVCRSRPARRRRPARPAAWAACNDGMTGKDIRDNMTAEFSFSKELFLFGLGLHVLMLVVHEILVWLLSTRGVAVHVFVRNRFGTAISVQFTFVLFRGFLWGGGGFPPPQRH